ncbi:unnamed protein product [Prorocentrum cordatum]|uniref:Uncharacterized protein n=1 Tax=Prorocentrum cordatum TaxID=2364126 RepID=A0ABN9SNT2_9DINO|nr:unnamed protein product [Polarella glacialis]
MARNDEEDEEGRKPHKANLDDEFLKNPYSGASFRNPFLDRNRLGNRSAPIILQAAEYSYNSLDETLAEWKCVSVSEASLKQMAPQSGISRRSPLQRAALQRLNDLQTGFEFIVALRKSSFVAPRVQRRRPEQKTISGQIVDKLCIEARPPGDSYSDRHRRVSPRGGHQRGARGGLEPQLRAHPGPSGPARRPHHQGERQGGRLGHIGGDDGPLGPDPALGEAEPAAAVVPRRVQGAD